MSGQDPSATLKPSLYTHAQLPRWEIRLRVHARGPKRYELDECARVKPFLYMHAQLSRREIRLKFLSRCARNEGSGESSLLARAISYNFHEMGKLANENLILIA